MITIIRLKNSFASHPSMLKGGKWSKIIGIKSKDSESKYNYLRTRQNTGNKYVCAAVLEQKDTFLTIG